MIATCLVRVHRDARESLSAGLGSVGLWGAAKGDGGADQPEVGEGVGEVAEELSAGADLLRVEAEVVGLGEHFLERQLRLFEPAGAG